jgi:uncharacterized protein (TIGR02284 family)
MPLSDQELVDVLNDLLETCYDGREGFQTAAAALTQPDAISLCQAMGQRVDEAASQLYAVIHDHGGQPADHGHKEARIHRGWIHLRAALAQKTDDAVLAEVERGEEESVRRYRHALAKNLPPDVHDLVADQLADVEEALTQVREVRKSW